MVTSSKKTLFRNELLTFSAAPGLDFTLTGWDRSTNWEPHIKYGELISGPPTSEDDSRMALKLERVRVTAVRPDHQKGEVLVSENLTVGFTLQNEV
jgi:hypothetical protein